MGRVATRRWRAFEERRRREREARDEWLVRVERSGGAPALLTPAWKGRSERRNGVPRPCSLPQLGSSLLPDAPRALARFPRRSPKRVQGARSRWHVPSDRRPRGARAARGRRRARRRRGMSRARRRSRLATTSEHDRSHVRSRPWPSWFQNEEDFERARGCDGARASKCRWRGGRGRESLGLPRCTSSPWPCRLDAQAGSRTTRQSGMRRASPWRHPRRRQVSIGHEGPVGCESHPCRPGSEGWPSRPFLVEVSLESSSLRGRPRCRGRARGGAWLLRCHMEFLVRARRESLGGRWFAEDGAFFE